MLTTFLLRDWIPVEGLGAASMQVAFEVTDYSVNDALSHTFRSAVFSFQCTSQIRTDEKNYRGRASGAKAWAEASAGRRVRREAARRDFMVSIF